MSDQTAQVVAENTVTPTQAAAVTQELGADGQPFDAKRAQELIEKLRKENSELKPKAKLADELSAEQQKLKDAQLSDLEKANKKALELEAQLKAVTFREMQRAAAEKVNLPMKFADRLRGETAEQLEADAAEILAALPAPQKPVLKTDPTNPGTSQVAETLAQKKARLSFQTVDFFGGTPQSGVIYPPEG